MQLFCPTCNAGVRFQDIDAKTKMATCRFCSAEFSVANFLDSQFADDEDEKPKKQKIIDMPRPNSVNVREDGLDLLITRKWSVAKGLGSVLFGLIFAGFTGFFVYNMLSGTTRSMRISGNSNILVLVLGIFAVVGAGMIVGGIYNIFNSTTMRVSKDKLAMWHHPLPWRNRTFDISGLQQLFVRQHITTTRSKNGTRTTITYSLNVVNGNGTQEKLQDNMQADAAMYIEQEIEKHLNIDNIAVRGEYGKGGWAF
jgi:hypothetical protein